MSSLNPGHPRLRCWHSFSEETSSTTSPWFLPQSVSDSADALQPRFRKASTSTALAHDYPAISLRGLHPQPVRSRGHSTVRPAAHSVAHTRLPSKI